MLDNTVSTAHLSELCVKWEPTFARWEQAIALFSQAGGAKVRFIMPLHRLLNIKSLPSFLLPSSPALESVIHFPPPMDIYMLHNIIRNCLI